MANKTYAQWCPVSRALDIIGERWTLLIIRDLGFGLRRFSELQSELVGISPSLLSGRLRQLTDAGVIERIDNRYQLTERGIELLDVVSEIGRWGIGLMGQPEKDEQFSDFFPRAAIGFMVRPEVLPDNGLVAELHLDDRAHTRSRSPRPRSTSDPHVASRSTTVRPPTPSMSASRGSLADLTRYRQGRVPAESLADADLVHIEGDPGRAGNARATLLCWLTRSTADGQSATNPSIPTCSR
ncbi:MAG: helix-turn-helix domain-containing protein [Acidimicrobiales bacterium]